MTFEYFGVVTRVRDSGAGEVRGLARLVMGIPEHGFDAGRLFEPDGSVFVDRLPSQLRVGAPVAFDAEENPQPRGPNRWWVKRKGGSPRIELHGFAVLDAAEFVVDPAAPRPALREDRILAGGLHMYLRYLTENGPCLRGPLTVRDGVFQIDEVCQWPDGIWPPKNHFAADDGSWEILLSRLEPSSGRPLDLMSGDELASWFLKKAEELPRLAGVVAQLHRETKKLLKSGFKDLTGEPERQLFEARFARALSILETLELGRSELERIAAAPAFAPLWHAALQARTAELEAEATAGLRHRLDEQKALNRAIEKACDERSGLEASLDRLRARQSKSRSDLAALEKEQREVDLYAGENQQRLLKDARALAPLWASRESAGVDASPFRARIPALAGGEPGAASIDGLRSDTVMACRLTVLRDPFSARELAAEWGWTLFVLQAEPHWLCFEDAWKAGLGAILEASTRDGGALLHLQDLDRSPPELWLRPLLDLASGLRDVLIEAERGWPQALRVTASLAPGPPCHPLGRWLLRHFAAPEPLSQKAAEARPEPAGLAGLETFVHRETTDLGERLAARARARGEEDREQCEIRAREVRREWPLTFTRES
jgi:hypothetical protein